MSLLSDLFYTQKDVVAIAKDLLGKFVFTHWKNAPVTGGMIVETEAYAGISDRACHAYGGVQTPRVAPMYSKGGIAYVYLCYGIHDLFNVVTNIEGTPHAVLIRAIEPLVGVETMLKRRGQKTLKTSLTAGPGSLTKALGIKTKHSGYSLNSKAFWIEDRNVEISPHQILASPRVGVAYAKEDALKPWRFRIQENIWTSKAK